VDVQVGSEHGILAGWDSGMKALPVIAGTSSLCNAA